MLNYYAHQLCYYNNNNSNSNINNTHDSVYDAVEIIVSASIQQIKRLPTLRPNHLTGLLIAPV